MYSKPEMQSEHAWLLTAHAQVLDDSQGGGNDSSVLGVQSVLDRNYDLRNDRQHLVASGAQHVVYGVAGECVVREFRFAQSSIKGSLRLLAGK